MATDVCSRKKRIFEKGKKWYVGWNAHRDGIDVERYMVIIGFFVVGLSKQEWQNWLLRECNGNRKNHGWKKQQRRNSLIPEFQCVSVHKRCVGKKIELHVLFETESFERKHRESLKFGSGKC